MIESKADLKEYLRRDYLASYLDHERPHIFGDEVMKYLIVLRKLEYWTNCGKGIIGKIFRLPIGIRIRISAFTSPYIPIPAERDCPLHITAIY